ncbi:hypothetical protein [Corynebacterium cystitidis]|uniref:hypothetical protein n=1 Tax=Corynebacterium cystitidis TaxID=35757 RepID=UPI00211E4852|nr:hypothetical protein [Corynebacterium cystitidis]
MGQKLNIKPSKTKRLLASVAGLAAVVGVAASALVMPLTKAIGGTGLGEPVNHAATLEQIQAFNDAVSGGQKEAFIITVDTTKGEGDDFKIFARSAGGIDPKI